MSRFQKLSLSEFVEALAQISFSRRIDVVHLHHTWRPSRAQWRGEESVESMWRYHVKVKGWSDIAQHVTIDPDGMVWTGRPWNLPPASAKGFNGNASVGPFMIETVGDFDIGKDELFGPQLDAVVGVIASVQKQFGLAPEALRFHRMMTDQKTCPGTSVDYDKIVELVRAASQRPVAHVTPGANGKAWASRSFTSEAARVASVVQRMADAAGTPDAFDAEPPENEMSADEIAIVTGLVGATREAPGGARAEKARSALDPAMLAELRSHVVNLNQGHFSDEGLFRSSRGDVDAIFQKIDEAARVKSANGDVPRLVLWAHGGLIDEEHGLWIAHQQLRWWRDNGVYPVFFVWETGFLDALRQILGGARAAARGFGEDIQNAALAKLVRGLGGVKIWSAMKRSAELAVAPDGGARYVAERLGELVRRHPSLEVHAVGHSAGSIFHAHFLPTAIRDYGVPAITSLQLLAPAIRTELFHANLAPLLHGHGLRTLTMFTMARDWEEADSVAIYRRSLLYLIRDALEPETGAEILGLDECVRRDPALVRLFGLDGTPGLAQVVWAVTEATTGRSASTSTSHGGFDNDRATMDSVATRILGATPLVTFPDEAIERAVVAWSAATKLLPDVSSTASTPPPSAPALPPYVHPGGGNRRVALCIGIDAYVGQPLGGCVADAIAWRRWLTAQGFECTPLLDRDARRAAIVDSMDKLIGSSRPGDVVVLQYSGHGTHLDDLDGDEADGQDEALCPFDIDQGNFLIDDDIAAIMANIPSGVNVTCFFDCCHSGTNTRFAVGPVPDGRGTVGRKARFLVPTAEMRDRYRTVRARGDARRAVPGRTEASMRNVVFAACQDNQVAWETAGQGEFTVRALEVLSQGIAGLTHESFAARVLDAFGPQPPQNPRLDCASSMRALPLLQPFGAGGSGVGADRGWVRGGFAGGGRHACDGDDLARTVADGLRAAADRIDRRR